MHRWTVAACALLLAPAALAERAPAAPADDAKAPGPSTFERLYPDRAEATSFLRTPANLFEQNYHPNYALDDDPQTAWVEGAPGNGDGEALTLLVSSMPSARRVKLEIRNGYQKSKALFSAHARPARVRVELLRGPSAHSAREVTLADAMDWQTVELPVVGHAGFDAVRLTLLSTVDGETYTDTGLSDVRVWVDSAVPYLADVERFRDAHLKAWIAERVEKARFFAQQPPAYPFAFSVFSAGDTHTTGRKSTASAVRSLLEGKRPKAAGDVLGAADFDVMIALAKRRAEVDAAGPWHRLVPNQARTVPEFDGNAYGETVWLTRWGMGALHTRDFSLLEATDRWAWRRKEAQDDTLAMGNVRRHVDESGQMLVRTVVEVNSERTVTETTFRYLMAYAIDGRLMQVLVHRTMEDDEMFEGTDEALTLIDVVWQADRIHGLKVRRVESDVEGYDTFTRHTFAGVTEFAAR